MRKYIVLMTKRKTTEEFIEEAKKVHGNKYYYSKTTYINAKSPITVICPIHGEFKQRPDIHLLGHGCPKCTDNSLTTEIFIKKANEIHCFKYDYSKSDYKGYDIPLRIICPIHGEFMQKPHYHLSGSGCQECGKIKSDESKRKNINQFVEEAKRIHSNKYDYSEVEYVDSKSYVYIICHKVDEITGKEHGGFWQPPDDHLQGKGCPICSGRYLSNTEEFIRKAIEIHGNKYDYSKSEYINSKTDICIICPEHGEFWQTPNKHLNGQGCPKCGIHLSKGEEEIYDMVVSILGENNVVRNDREVLEGKELDIYIPSKNLAIEFNGLIWHSDYGIRGKDKYYHLNKTEECKKRGIRLIQIFEDEYDEHKEIVLNKIKHALNANNNSIHIGGRNCNVIKTDSKTAKEFLNKFHIQGFSPSTVYYGAYYNDELVSIMSFKKETNSSENWELSRFATNIRYRINGIASKIFTRFIKDYAPLKVKSFLDRRWNIEGDTVYEKLGFKVDKILPPDYHYVKSSKRYHKFGFRKDAMIKKYGDRYKLASDMTESEMAKIVGFNKIWDCGLVRYIWKRNE